MEFDELNSNVRVGRVKREHKSSAKNCDSIDASALNNSVIGKNSDLQNNENKSVATKCKSEASDKNCVCCEVAGGVNILNGYIHSEKTVDTVGLKSGDALDEKGELMSEFVKAGVNNTISNYDSNKQKAADKRVYEAKKFLMTAAERKLYSHMEKEFNRYLTCINKKVVVCPMVRLADFIDVRFRHTSKSPEFSKIAMKHIDYVICDSETFEIICCVELDDDTHTGERDKFKDNLFKEVGLELFRIAEPIKYVLDGLNTSNILDYILEHYAPKCPECGAQTELKKSNKRSNYNHRFYGCKNYMATVPCRYTLDID